MDKRAVGDRIVKRTHLFQLRSRERKSASKQQFSTQGEVTENEPSGIVALMAHTQQILVQAQRQIYLAADRVMTRLPKENVQELRGGPQLLPQLLRAGIGLARFRRWVALKSMQHRPQGAAKFELLPLSFGG